MNTQESLVIIDESEHSEATLLFAHGAGAGMDHEFMSDMAKRLSRKGIRVIRFNFPYMVKRMEDGKRRPPDRAPKLLACFEEKIQEYSEQGPLFLAGKSMGGRMASHLTENPNVCGVMCLGFPFHPPGKPENYKGEHLATLDKPTLILQGERDTFGTREECQQFKLAKCVNIQFIPDGDHSLKPRVKSGHTEASNRQLAVELMSQFIQEQKQGQ